MQGKEWDPDKKLDFKAIMLAVWLPMLFWLVGVVGATLSGFPGVICVTPLSWLMGINVGQRSVQYSANPDPRQKLIEAAIGGVILGVFEALVAVLVIWVATPLGLVDGDGVDPILSGIMLFLFLGLLGGTICAGLAVLFGKQLMRRMGQS